MSAQEKTDLKKAIGAFKISDKAAKITSSLKWTPEQKWAVLMGSVLLGGTAFVAGSVHANGSPGITAGSDEAVTPSDSTQTDQPALDHGVEKEVAGGTITPGPNVNISSSHVTDQMSFAEAFNEARAECGPGSIFEWRGNVYNTYYQEEWMRLSAEEKQAFLKSVGFKPAVSPTKNDHSTPDPDTKVEDNNKKTNSEDKDPTPEPEPQEFGDYRITNQDGVNWLFRDSNHDGIFDQAIRIDEKNGEMIVYSDKSGDGSIDYLWIKNLQTGATTDEGAIESPVTVTISNIDAGKYGEVVKEGTYTTPEEEKAVVDNFKNSAEAYASVEEEAVSPVDSITHEVVITDAPPVEDEDYDNDIDVV